MSGQARIRFDLFSKAEFERDAVSRSAVFFAKKRLAEGRLGMDGVVGLG
ncbi:MAG: hypothetical protein ABJL67_03095 [Sulfitobacter sp.]